MRLLSVLFARVYRARGRAIFRVFVLTAVLILYSSAGFMFFELESKPDLQWADALWWSVVTMTTVGYGDLFPTSSGGRFFVGFPTMIFGISILGYLLSNVATYFIEARSKERKGMGESLLEDHVLVVHFQSLDRQLSLLKELRADEKTKNSPVLLIDDALEDLPDVLADLKVRFIRGNATKESTLERANFREATHAIILSRDPNDPGSDNHNLAVALTLEQLHPEIISVAECLDPERVPLMYKAGCDSVICLAEMSAGMLVSELLDPGLSGAISILTSNLPGQSFYFSEVKSGQEFAQVRAKLSQSQGIAIGYKRGADVVLNPADSEKLYAGDAVVCIAAHRPEPLT